MAKYENSITYHLKTQLDESGISKLLNSLKQVEAAASKMQLASPQKSGLTQTIKAAQDLRTIISSAFNPELGTFSLTKFQNGLRTSGKTLGDYQTLLGKAGASGQKAFNDVSNQILKVNTGMKTSNHMLDQMARTMGNTIRWGITASIFQNITGEIRQAFNYVKELDTSLNNIRIVTGMSAESMADFAREANRAAKAIGTTTTQYTDAALIYYQQGKNTKESQRLAEITTKAANVTGQSAEDVSNQLTSVWNGYKVASSEAESYVDVMAAVAADSAADLEELSTAMSKVASAAKNQGVEFDQLNAMIATTVSVTKQAPESVGTAYKTIFSRLGDLAVDTNAADEFGVKLGEISTKMKAMGVEILDENGNLRDMGTIVEEIGGKWDTWSRAQQQAAAIAMAGRRQYNNLFALFDNFDMYNKEMETAAGALGTLNEQNAIYMESTEAHLKRVTVSAERLNDAFFDTNSINDAADAMSGFLTIVANLVESFGGGINTLLLLGVVGAKVFNNQLASGLAGVVRNFRLASAQAKDLLALQELIATKSVRGGISLMKDKTASSQANRLESQKQDATGQLMLDKSSIAFAAGNMEKMSSAARRMWQNARDIGPYFRSMTQDQIASYNVLQDQTQELYEQKTLLEEEARKRIEIYNTLFATADKQMQVTENGRIDRGGITSRDIQANADKMGSRAKGIGIIARDFKTDIDGLPIQKGDLMAGIQSVKQDFGDVLSKEQVRRVTDLYNQLKRTDKTSKEYGGTVAYIQEELTKLSIELQATANNFKTLDRDIEKSASRSEDLKMKIAQLEQSLLTFKASLSFQNQIGQFVSMIGAIGQLGFAFTSLSNIATTWQDDSLGAGEKLFQTITALGMGLPMLMSGYKEFTNILSDMGAAKRGLAETTKALAIAELQEAAASLEAAEANHAQAVSDVEAAMTGKKAALVSAQEALADSAGALASAQKAEAQAAEAAAKAASSGAGAGAFLTPAMATGIGIVTVAIMAGVAAWSAYDKAQREARNNEIQMAKEAADGLKESSGLIEQFKSQKAIYEDTGAGSQDLIDTSKKLNDALGRQDLIVTALAGKWDAYKTSVEKAQKAQLKEAESANKTGVVAALKNAKGMSTWTQPIMDVTGLQNTEYANMFNTISHAGEPAQRGYLKTGTLEEQYNTYLRLKQLLEEIDSGEDAALSTWAKKREEDVEQLRLQYASLSSGFSEFETALTSATDIQNQLYSNSMDTSEITTAAQLTIEIDKLAAAYERATDGKINDDEARKRAEEYLRANALSPDMIQAESNKQILTENFVKNRDKAVGEKDIETLTKLAGGNQELSVAIDMFGEMNEPKTYENIKSYLESLEGDEALKLKIEAKIETNKANLEAVQTAIQELGEGKGLSEKTQAALGDIDSLQGLTVGTQEYNDALFAVEQQLLSNLKTMGAGKEVEKNKQVQLQRSVDSLENLKQANADVKEAEDNLRQAKKNHKQGDAEILLAEGKLSTARYKARQALIEYTVQTAMARGANIGLAGAVRAAAASIAGMTTGQAVKKLNSLKKAAEEAAKTYAAFLGGLSAASPVIRAESTNPVFRQRMNDLRKEAEAAQKAYSAFKAAYNAGSGLRDYGGGGSSSGGGGGGGGGGSSKKQKMDLEASSYDRYLKINNLLAKLANSFETVAQAQEKLAGKALLDNLNKQLAIIQKQLAAQKEKLKEQRKEASELKKSLQKKGVSFNADGDINNYQTVLKKAEKKVNDAIRKYNKLSAKKQKNQEKKVNKAKEELEVLKNLISGYDELIYSEIYDSQNEVQELQDKLIELQIEKFTIKIETQLDFTDLQRSFTEFLAIIAGSDLEDPFVALDMALSNLSTYTGSSGDLAVLYNALQEVNDAIAIMKAGGTSIYGTGESGMAAGLEAQTDLINQLIGATSTYNTLVLEAKKLAKEWVGEVTEDLGDIQSKFETLNKTLEYQAKLIKLLYGEQAYSQMASYYEAQKIKNNAQLAASALQIKSLIDARDAIADKESEAWKALDKSVLEAQQSYQSLIEASLANLANAYQNTVNQIIDAFVNNLTGMSLKNLEDDWKALNEQSDRYLDSTTSAYNINKLQSKYIEAMNGTDSVSAKARLNALMEQELDYLREKGELTQYDVDRANMLYDIEMKRIAMEEAQSNKSQMKLARDAQGNYSFVYSADQDKVEKARQDLQDAEQALHELNKNAFEKSQSDFLVAYKALLDKAKEVYTDPANSDLTEEERRAKVTRFMEAGLADLIAQNEIIKQNYAELGADLLNNSPVQVLIDSIAESGLDTLLDGFFEDLGAANQQYQDEVDNLPLPDLTQMTNDAKAATDALTQANTDLMTSIELETIALLAKLDALQKIIEANKTLLEQAAAAAQLGLINQNQNVNELTNPSGFDTGGYTGAWGSGGKLAVLHQKEIVLNEGDTLNLLAAVATLRKMENSLRATVFAANSKLLSDTQIGLNSSGGAGGYLEQQVHIVAEFPAVTSSIEIHNALTGLVNSASQHANKN